MRRDIRGALSFLVSVPLIAGVLVSPASAAMPVCEGQVFQKTLYSDQGVLEAVTVGRGGKLFVSGTDGSGDSALLRRYGAPGRGSQLISTAGPGPGGLAWAGRRLLWGNGNTQANGAIGDTTPSARLYSVNPATRGRKLLSSTLGMANGIARTAEGAVIASNALGGKLDLVSPSGVTTNGWAVVNSANGLTVSPDGRYLFANQTLEVPSKISRVEIADPSNVTTWFTAETLGGLDGLTRDQDGRLYAAAWLTGEIWKIGRDRKACVLASGIPQVTSLAFGAGKKGFSRGRLFAVGFGGDIIQIKGARRAVAPG